MKYNTFKVVDQKVLDEVHVCFLKKANVQFRLFEFSDWLFMIGIGVWYLKYVQECTCDLKFSFHGKML